LQHAENPVDWYPWGEEAFAAARLQGKPIFLSVGYSACHWCHVMERESFEDEQVAALLNENFISIKVDREERPDIDEIYLGATQLMTGHGGWPNSVFLTDLGEPWFAGTYFPRDDHAGQPGFITVVGHLAELWRARRDDVRAEAAQIARTIAGMYSGTGESPGATEAAPSPEMVGRAIEQLRASFDHRHGGFSTAPKFPPHASLRLLLYEYRHRHDASLLEMATATLRAMVQGGIHDHVGGGFHRYSTDPQWLVPHFEKMLYDNAQMLANLADAYSLTGGEDFRDAAAGIAEWLTREMTHPEGGLYSAQDADSDGEEGASYVWRHAEIIEALGVEEGAFLARAYNVAPLGNYHDPAGQATGGNILHLAMPIDDLAAAMGIDPDALRRRLSADRAKLLERRSRRLSPGIDDKIIAAWNGLAIGALARAGSQLEMPAMIAAARRAAEFVLTKMRDPRGRLARSWRQGQAGGMGFLEDYAALAGGLLDLYDATGERHWVGEAQTLVGVLEDYFWDSSAGGFFMTSDDHEGLLARIKNPYDEATPSGNALAARAMLRLAELDSLPEYRRKALECLEAFGPAMLKTPHGLETMILCVAMHIDANPPAAAPPQVRAEPPKAVSTIPPVTVEAFPAAGEVPTGTSLAVTLRLRVQQGWHANSNRPVQDYLEPTTLTLRADKSMKLAKVDYPPGEEVVLGGQPCSAYSGTVEIAAVVAVAADAPPGAATLTLELRVQPCSERECLPPQTHALTIPLRIVSPPPLDPTFGPTEEAQA
jgi:uncharacterized protein YyaL (SSP411 family)